MSSSWPITGRGRSKSTYAAQTQNIVICESISRHFQPGEGQGVAIVKSSRRFVASSTSQLCGDEFYEEISAGILEAGGGRLMRGEGENQR